MRAECSILELLSENPDPAQVKVMSDEEYQEFRREFIRDVAGPMRENDRRRALSEREALFRIVR